MIARPGGLADVQARLVGRVGSVGVGHARLRM
jgi:hypothetical protein